MTIMMGFIQVLVVCGVYGVLRPFSDTFAWGWIGGISCSILVRLVFDVPA